MAIGILGGLSSAYASGAAAGFQSIMGAFQKGNVVAPNFNALYAKVMSEGKVSVELKDLKDLERRLLEVAPELSRKFRSGASAVGRPAANEMRKTFRKIDAKGPIFGRRKEQPSGKRGGKGRTYDSMYSSYVSNISWYQTKFQTGRKGIDVNYKNRRAGSDLQKLKVGRDGTLSIVRILVKPPAYVMADISGRGSRRKSTGSLSREYRIHAFGQAPYTVRRHKVNATSVQAWIRALGSGQGVMKNRGSRYAYPTMQKHAPAFARNVTNLLNSTIAELNKRMAS